MRMLGAGAVFVALSAIASSPSPAAAFGLRLGPFHIGLPLPFIGSGHRRHAAPQHSLRTAALPDDRDTATAAPSESSTRQGLNATLLYPAVAAPEIYDEVLWPSASTQWPFTYESIIQAAFAKPAQHDQTCQMADRSASIVERIRNEVKPTGAQLQQLQKLGGALGVAAKYFAGTCPKEIPAQPVARLQTGEWQIEKLAQGLDIIRQPLQDFEQSLNAEQRARFASMAPEPAETSRLARPERTIAPECAEGSAAVDRPTDRIIASVQPDDTQHGAVTQVRQSLEGAARDLNLYCPTTKQQSPLARLDAIESRLDATWRAMVTIEVALSDFESGLNDAQRARLEGLDMAAAQ